MDFTQTTYEIARLYLNEQKHNLTEDVFNWVAGALRARNYVGLSSATKNFPKSVYHRETFRILRQVEAFFKKNDAFTDPSVAELSAYYKFVEGEAACRETNARLSIGLDPALHGEWSTEIDVMQKVIAGILGDFTGFLDRLPNLLSVTRGATYHRPRKSAYPAAKIYKRIPCSGRARKYLVALGSFFGYRVEPRRWDANRVTTVPKDWRTYRTIACEPDGNVLLQLAVDTWVKKRLRRHGINLSRQETNQELARQGSLLGSWATVDLSNASDTSAKEAVALLFPHDWLQYLLDVRSNFYTFGKDKTQYVYEKISSMGNGYTFVLETLMFYAALKAVGSSGICYGDDIIVEPELYSRLAGLLGYLGFSVNADKSFTDGPFRESCGADYWEGVNITPRYLRRNARNPQQWAVVANILVQLGHPGGELWKLATKIVSRNRIPLIPWSGSESAGFRVPSASLDHTHLKHLKERSYVLKPNREDLDKVFVSRSDPSYQGWTGQRKTFTDVNQRTYRGYVAVVENEEDTTSRGLLLWFLSHQGARGSLFGKPKEPYGKTLYGVESVEPDKTLWEKPVKYKLSTIVHYPCKEEPPVLLEEFVAAFLKAAA